MISDALSFGNSLLSIVVYKTQISATTSIQHTDIFYHNSIKQGFFPLSVPMYA
jgi:3-isopropylmalate dehydratase small subunit